MSTNIYDYIKKRSEFIDVKNDKYPNIGNTVYMDLDDYIGYYWYYETKYYIITIHDCYIKKDMIENDDISLFKNHSYISSSYHILSSGEILDPYCNVTSGSMSVFLLKRNPFKNTRFLYHGNYPLFTVSIMYREDYVRDIMNKILPDNNIPILDLFIEANSVVTSNIEKIAKSILECKMDVETSKIFFEAKSMEWLTIIIDAYIKKHKDTSKKLDTLDSEAIKRVAEYIDNHYNCDLNQELLKKIAMMSSTKLKTSFKKEFSMSITEYIQKKRINIAENLLLSTDLDIKLIAKSVGYNSQSRFSTLFKRYKSIYPKDVRKISNINTDKFK